MDKVLGDKKAILFFMIPATILFSAVIIATIVFSIYFSLFRWDGITSAEFVGIKNYINIFAEESHHFVPSLKNSLVLAGVNVFGQLPVAIILAIIIAGGIKGEKFFRTVYFIPVIIMTAITGMLWNKILDINGLVNEVLKILGFSKYSRNWLGDPDTALLGVALAGMWQWMGYYLLILYSAIKSIPGDIYEAATIDGAGKFRKALSVTIPLISPMIKVCVVFMLVGSMKAFDLIYVMTGGGPFRSSEVPTVTMYINIFRKYYYGVGSSMAVVILVLCMGYAAIVNFAFKKTDDIRY